MRLHRPGLIVHTFLADEATLREVWPVAASLRMDQPIGRWPVEPAGSDRPDLPFVVLAGRQRRSPGAVHQAIAYQVRDVFGVSVILAPNDDTVGWDRLAGIWAELAPEPPAGTFGTVTVHTALLALPRRWHGGRANLTRVDPESLAGRLGSHLPEPAIGWAPAWCSTDDGIVAWELPADDTLSHRRLVAVTAAGNEPALDDWTWTGTGTGLPALTRYLLHAAKLRYQHRVLETGLPALRAAVIRAEHACAVLDELLNAEDPPLAQVLAADLASSSAQTDQSGLITAIGDVRAMARTVQVAERNMTVALGDAIESAPAGPPALDAGLAQWLREQLRTEQTYLESAYRRLREVGRLAANVIDQRQRHRQESLTLLQTSIIGALLMVLAAIQSLSYKTPLPGPMLAPAICVLGAVALLLPPTLLRRPSEPQNRGVTTAAAGLAAAAFGWLGATVGWVLATGHGAPPGWSAVVAGASFVLFAGVTGVVTRRRASRR
jgi:hypothetical protein